MRLSASTVSHLTLNGRVSWPFFLLAAIVVVALVLRLHGINWDDGYGFHPDERDIYMRADCMYALLTDAPHASSCGYLNDHPEAEPGLSALRYFFDPERSPLNPHWFPLGSILIYALVFLRSIVELFTDVGGFDMRYAGRTLSALADVGTVLMVFLLGRRIYGRNVGLLAAGLTALAVIHVQHSHFYRPETFTVLLTLASIWATLRMVEKRRLRDSVLLGVIVGLALAPKVNVLPILAPLALGYGYRILDEADGLWDEITPAMVFRIAGHAALAGVVVLAVFFVTTPYAFIDIGAFVGDVRLQTRMAREAGFFPFTVQYVDTPAFLYQIRQTAVWGLGVPLGVVAWLSIPFTALMLAVDRRNLRGDLILLAWVVPSVIFLESFEVRFLRYLFPLMPVMILMASRMMLWNVDRSGVPLGEMCERVKQGISQLRQRHIDLRHWIVPLAMGSALLLLVFVVGSTAFYSLSFQRMYANEHPANQAAEWLQTEVPRNSPIVLDNHWDEYLPQLYGRVIWQFPLYEPDTQQKMRELAVRLSHSDYLIFYSARPYASASRDPERFPYSYNYYRLLFAGELGYRLHREFTNYPSLGGVVFRDDALAWAGLHSPEPEVPSQGANFTLNLGYADDNVSGYDHPRVLVFRNASRLDAGTLGQMLAPPYDRLSHGDDDALMLSPEALETQRSGGTFTEIVDRDGWVNDAPVLAWLLVVELIYLISLPLAIIVFRPLPDHGIILARILGILLVCYLTWLVVSLGWLEFSRGAVYLGMGAVALGSGIALWFSRQEVWSFVRSRWRLIVFSEGVFIAAFLAFVAVRYLNPDLWHPYRGGEKPMELAYLTAVFRSTSLPPYDPWFAGGYLNYYYWGYFVIACINRVAAVLPTTAFNLAVPLFFALTFAGAFSIGYNLAAGVRNAGVRKPGNAGGERPPGGGAGFLPPVLCGGAAALFVAVIANIDGMLQVIRGAWLVLAKGEAWAGFDFWRSSRMISPLDSFEPPALAFWLPDHIPGDAGASWHITEFPYFTFLFADLHAHMMVIPFTLLALGLGLALIAGLRDGSRGWFVLCGLALALTLGALWAINSWDYPSYVLLSVAMLGLAVLFTRLPARRGLVLFCSMTLGVVALSLLFFLPFHQFYETFNDGLDPSRWRTPIDRFLAIHSLFIFIVGSYLFLKARKDLAVLARSFRLREQLPRRMGWLRAVFALLVIVALLSAASGYFTVALMVTLLALLAVAGWRTLCVPEPSRPFEAFVLVMIAMAALIVAGVDLVTVEGDIGRMNTLFKYYLEVWVFMAIAAAYMLWRMVSSGLSEARLLRRVQGTEDRPDPGLPGIRLRVFARIGWATVVVVLIGASLVYTVLGTRARVDDRFAELPPTLDGTAYMAAAQHWERDEYFPLGWDLQAIRWLQENVEGSPVVLEAHMDQYRWGGRIANNTGLPTIIGWPWHQTQQRFDYRGQIEHRASDVRLAYESTDIGTKIEVLRKYNVSYVVLGDLEKLNYAPGGLAMFDDMAEEGKLRKVYENEGTTIFRVELP